MLNDKEAQQEQLESGVPSALHVRTRTRLSIKDQLDDNWHLEMKDPKSGDELELEFRGIERTVYRLDAAYANEVLESSGYGFLSKAAVTVRAPFTENLYVGRTQFEDVKTGKEVLVDTWMTWDDGESSRVFDLVAKIDGKSVVDYGGHATTQLTVHG